MAVELSEEDERARQEEAQWKRWQRATAGQQGGYARTALHTPLEISIMGQAAAQKRFENMALAKYKTPEERAALEADEGELLRRAEIWKRATMAKMRAKSQQTYRERWEQKQRKKQK